MYNDKAILNGMKKVILGLAVFIPLWIAASFTRGLFTSKTADTEELVITAHRGGAALGEENTIECIKRGMAAGAASIEIDVHITADNHVVVCHDATVDRTTNGTGTINDMTLEQIKALRIINADGEATQQQIPTLEQVLETLNGEVELLLEIKRKNGNNKGIEEAALRIVREYGALPYTTFQSFDDSVLEKLHSLEPSNSKNCSLPRSLAYQSSLMVHQHSFLRRSMTISNRSISIIEHSLPHCQNICTNLAIKPVSGL